MLHNVSGSACSISRSWPKRRSMCTKHPKIHARLHEPPADSMKTSPIPNQKTLMFYEYPLMPNREIFALLRRIAAPAYCARRIHTSRSSGHVFVPLLLIKLLPQHCRTTPYPPLPSHPVAASGLSASEVRCRFFPSSPPRCAERSNELRTGSSSRERYHVH